MAELGLQTRVVQRSQDHRQLKASIDALNRKLRERIERGLVGVGLTAEGIKVLIAGSASADERAAVCTTVKDNAPDATVVQTSRDTLQAEPAVSCNGSNGRYCNELIAGIRYHTQSGGCTAGFYSGPAGVYDPKMMTAGHCITLGGVTWSSCRAGGSPCLHAGYERENRYGGQSGDNGIILLPGLRSE
jgi:hypothetical protein